MKNSKKFIIVTCDRPIPSCGFFNGNFHFNLVLEGFGKVAEFSVNGTIPHCDRSIELIEELGCNYFINQFKKN